MKKFFLFFLIIAAFSFSSLYLLEKSDLLLLRQVDLAPQFTEQNGLQQLSWKRLPYLCKYRLDIYSHTTGRLPDTPRFHLLHSFATKGNSLPVPASGIPTSFRLQVYGLFGLINDSFPVFSNPNFPSRPHPVSIFHYTEESPASLKPFLVWHIVPGAVCYELELLSAPPSKEGGITPDAAKQLYITRNIFTNGWQADLTKLDKNKMRGLKKIYWRVRALDLKKQPIGEFCQAEELFLDESLPVPTAPLINSFDKLPSDDPILYPVYQWIPLHGEMRYEVELLTHPPVTENGTEPSADRSWHSITQDVFNCYDEYARPDAGEYYWRVRAIDKAGKTIGTYSDTACFKVLPHKERVFAAAFGDSITHGGGAMSFSPANPEYSYTTFLDFPALNLSRSGDTAKTSNARFEADVLRYRPQNLIILTGANDLRSDLPAEAVIADLERIRQKCLANDIRPIFLTLMPINPANIYTAFHTETYDGWRAKLNAINAYLRQQEYCIDLEPYFYDKQHQLLDTALAIDGLHPDIIGKMLMAEIINQHKDLFRK